MSTPRAIPKQIPHLTTAGQGIHALRPVEKLKAPFPYYGGKSAIADKVWSRFGNVPNYIEPFCGSMAVLLNRPTEARIETVNDLDCHIANFYRAMQFDAEGVAQHADHPVNEADLHARHKWLHNQKEWRERMKTDPDYYDVKIAGWWVWGLSAWIGGGWCRLPPTEQMPSVGHGGKGINRMEVRQPKPHVMGRDAGQGVHRVSLHQKLPHVGDGGTGVHRQSVSTNWLLDYFQRLQARLRRVRVCCGDWTRVVTEAVTICNGVTGVLLDPPYGVEKRDDVYAHESRDVSVAVREWALANGSNRDFRIALCGYEGEHDMPADWECVEWKANGGYSNQNQEVNDNKHKERVWFSPHCIKPSQLLF